MRGGRKPPAIGSLWAWEPGKPDAAALIRVTVYRKLGSTWLIGAQVIAGGPGAGGSTWWNDLSRFREACHRVSPRPWGRTWLARLG